MTNSSLLCITLWQSALPTQGLSSNHLLSLDALLAIVQTFQEDGLSSHPTRSGNPYLPKFATDEGESGRERQAVVTRGSTQLNSAGIIFSSGPERETELVEQSSITSVHSESALVGHVSGGETVNTKEQSGWATTGRDIMVKAASGYMMAVGSKEEEGDMDGESAPVKLPLPKELIEIRQRKKVRILCALD